MGVSGFDFRSIGVEGFDFRSGTYWETWYGLYVDEITDIHSHVVAEIVLLHFSIE